MGYTRGETSGIVTGSYFLRGPFPAGATINNGTISFEEKGPFLGVSYSYYIKDSGSFSFSLAYAQLDGEILFVDTETLLVSEVTTISSQSIDGDVDGLSYSVTWTDQLSETTLYNISLKTTRYKFDATTPAAGEDSSFDEEYDILSIGVSKFF